ncbi:MAG: SusD/RagB family nutrient-binding outer membrane lipoprotein, partial [Prolixibacteraceae bacterium]
IFSKLLNENSNPLLKAVVLQADEVQFLLAEAHVKGYITNGNAEDYYKKGVELSLKRWGEPLPAAYFNNAKAKFPATGTTAQKLAKIGLQKWIGLFMMGAESYTDFRRTRLPAIEKNAYLGTGGYVFPLRYRYPETEMANNSINYQAAVAKLDKGDTEFSKMWLMQ